MEKSLRNFLLLSSLFGILSGCATFKAGQKIEMSETCKATLAQHITTATYDTKIDFFKKHLSGLLVFKALNDTTERAVFITETGFKFFDLEFTPNTFTTRYCLAALNKKPIIAIFKKDFGLLLNAKHGMPVGLSEKSSLKTYIFAADTRRFDYFTVNRTGDGLVKIESGGRISKPLTMDIQSVAGEHFDSVRVVHRGLGLKMTFKKIER
jgi:hypothetical protein